MSHRPLQRKDFEGKTIQAVDVRAVNIIRFNFTDGSSIAIEHERHGMVACDVCAAGVPECQSEARSENQGPMPCARRESVTPGLTKHGRRLKI